MNQTSLPEGFQSLEAFVNRWAIRGTAERDRCRGDSTEQERSTFFNAARDLVQPALERLDQKPLAELDEREERLMNLMLAFVHVAMAVEIQQRWETRHAGYRKLMKITRSPADTSLIGS